MVGYGQQRYQLAPWENNYNSPKKKKNPKTQTDLEIQDSQNITEVSDDNIWSPNIKTFKLKI